MHSSETNQTDIHRRAFSVCYMRGETKSRGGAKFRHVLGEGALRLEDLAKTA